MKCERYKKLESLPLKITADRIFSVAEFSRAKEISISSIYNRIDSVYANEQKWEDYIAYQHRKKIVIVTIKTTAKNEKSKQKQPIRIS